MTQKKTNFGRNIIFVGGAPRSGTTMIQNMLDSHPEILGLPEFFLTKDMVEVRNKFHWYIDNKYIDQICSTDQVDNYVAKFIHQYFEPFLNDSKYRWISEKTPHNVLVFDELMEIFPQAKFFHVLRDPRAVVASLLEVYRKAKEQNVWSTPIFTKSIREAIKYTKQCQEAGFKAQEKVPDRVCMVKYEEITENPKKETKRMCEFLEIEWSENMIRPADFEHMGERSITAEKNKMFYDTKKFNRNPETVHKDKWKKTLSFAQQARISKAFEDDKNLKALGYDFSLNHLTQMDRFTGKFISGMRKTIGDVRTSLKEII